MDVDMKTWFVCNPFAQELSLQIGQAVHLWSLDSGACAGFTLFVHGQLEERDVAFSSQPEEGVSYEIIPEIEVVPYSSGARALEQLMNLPGFSLATYSQTDFSLEWTVARIMAHFGVQEHLLDYDKLSGGDGAYTVVGDEYIEVELIDWVAIRFQKTRRSAK
jgi:hypothetical protein